ncbi:MAG TPA: ScyD/ScyE family protein [Aggregatilineales bacterium]|nr:ScyD/ScyE family protein [Aggregatilineales bacterium]
MKAKRFLLVSFSVMLTVVLVIPAFAQDGAQILVDGLTNPRNMSYDSAGNLYIAEAGATGGLVNADGDNYGASSQITMITPDGERDVIVRGLISAIPGTPRGAHAIIATDDSLWIALGDQPDLTIPWTHGVVELDRETGRVKRFLDLLQVEVEQDPDGNMNMESNAVDLALTDDGTLLIANAGCNCLQSWSEADGLQVVAAWSHAEDNPVPTSVEVGPNGDIYVGFLTGFPFPQGGSRIERWSNGELAQTYTGLTAVTGLLVTDDGTIYAVEFGVYDQGWGPGRVVMVTDSGVEPVLEGLNQPYGIAQSPDGTIVVSVGGAGEGGDQVIVLPGM